VREGGFSECLGLHFEGKTARKFQEKIISEEEYIKIRFLFTSKRTVGIHA
jgi:hypothetical protein